MNLIKLINYLLINFIINLKLKFCCPCNPGNTAFPTGVWVILKHSTLNTLLITNIWIWLFSSMHRVNGLFLVFIDSLLLRSCDLSNSSNNRSELYCPQSFSWGGLYSSGNGLLLIVYDWLLWSWRVWWM